MRWGVFWTTFVALFLAEMGDKTQLAVITLSAQTKSPVAVFLGAALALTLVSFLGIAVGSLLGHYLPEKVLKTIAAIVFILIGVLMLADKL
jgi:putative Ca2+/H+ antiporter (TMEM165/GDT1 family)